MAVYLQGGMVLLDSGAVAIDTGCCCGEACCIFRFTLHTHTTCEGTTMECAGPGDACNLIDVTNSVTDLTFSSCDEYYNSQHYINPAGGIDTGASSFLFILTRTPPDDHWYLDIVISCLGHYQTASPGPGSIDLGTSPLGFFSWNHVHNTGADFDVPYMNYAADLLIECVGVATIGACCHTDGGCVTESSNACGNVGGIYLGNGTACGTDICPDFGACCFSDGCTISSEDDCTGVAGTWHGVGTVCEDYVGACCFEGVCFDDTHCQDYCDGFGGTFFLGVTCDPDPC